MKFFAETLPLQGRETWQMLEVGNLRLSIHWPGWKTPFGRECALVQGLDDAPIGGYIGLSLGADGYHIGSPSENVLLRQAAEEQGWQII